MRVSTLLALLVSALCAFPLVAGAEGLYWIDANFAAPTLNRADADGISITSVPLPVGSLPEGLAADAIGNVFWAEASWLNADLNRSTYSLAGITPIVSGGSVLRGVALDEVAQQLFWTSSNQVSGAAIHRAGVNGTGAVPLILLGPSANPRGIAVDHAGGKIYWADFDQSAIYRANLDGSASGVWLALTPGSGPYGVAFHAPTQRVYWTEYNSGTLKRINTNLTGNALVLSGLANPTYLVLDPVSGRMYWSEGGAGTQRIRRAFLDGTGAITLPCPLTTYGGLAFSSANTVSLPKADLPTEFALERAWPNPGSGPIHLAFSLPRDANVRLSVFDLQGREVAVLADGVVTAGRHEKVWNQSGTVPAGMYFVRLSADGRVWSGRLALIR